MEKDIRGGKEKSMSLGIRRIQVAMILVVAIIYSAAVQDICLADSWVPAGTNQYGVGYIEVDSIVLAKDRKTIKFWSKIKFSDEARKRYREDGVTWANRIYEMKQLLLVNYAEKTFRSLSVVYYDYSGRTVDSVEESFKYSHIVPGSTVDVLMRKALELSGQQIQGR